MSFLNKHNINSIAKIAIVAPAVTFLGNFIYQSVKDMADTAFYRKHKDTYHNKNICMEASKPKHDKWAWFGTNIFLPILEKLPIVKNYWKIHDRRAIVTKEKNECLSYDITVTEEDKQFTIEEAKYVNGLDYKDACTTLNAHYKYHNNSGLNLITKFDALPSWSQRIKFSLATEAPSKSY